MVAGAKPQQWNAKESEKLRGERDQIKFIDRRFERWQVVGFRKGRRRQDVPPIEEMKEILYVCIMSN